MRAFLVFGTLLLAACSTSAVVDDSTYGASIGIVNHTNKFIYSAAANGAGGSHMAAWGAGIGNVCCVMVPKKWYPGMQVLVSWDMPEGSKHVMKEKLVDVERYEETGSLYLHFFSNDQVRAVVSQYAGWSPMHPIPASQKPVP